MLDIDTAFGFFGGDRSKSLARVSEEIEALCSEWNEDHKNKVNKNSIYAPLCCEMPIVK